MSGATTEPNSRSSASHALTTLQLRTFSSCLPPGEFARKAHSKPVTGYSLPRTQETRLSDAHAASRKDAVVAVAVGGLLIALQVSRGGRVAAVSAVGLRTQTLKESGSSGERACLSSARALRLVFVERMGVKPGNVGIVDVAKRVDVTVMVGRFLGHSGEEGETFLAGVAWIDEIKRTVSVRIKRNVMVLWISMLSLACFGYEFGRP